MAERDDPVDATLGAAYRSLPDDGPPPAMDAAILAAARASVAAKPQAPRTQWAVPVSLAAVLVLSVAVSLRVAEERPVVDPVREPERAATTPVAPVPSAKSPPVAVPDPAPPATPPAAVVAVSPKRADAPPAPAAAMAPTAPAPEPAAPAAVAPQLAAAAEPLRDSVASQAPAAAPRMAARAQAAAGVADMAKRSAEAEHRAPQATPEAWLQGIADLRAQARHAEADERLAEFHRRYPGYAITPEMQQKIAAPR